MTVIRKSHRGTITFKVQIKRDALTELVQDNLRLYQVYDLIKKLNATGKFDGRKKINKLDIEVVL